MPGAWLDLLRRMLSVEPEGRFPDAGRLLAQLHALGRRLHLGVPRSAALYATGRVVPSARELAARALCAPFVGHAAVTERLARVLEQPCVALVDGPAGAGRTRLIREALRTLQLAGVRRGGVTPTLLADLATADAIDVQCAVVHQPLSGIAHVRWAQRCVAAWARGGRSLSVVLELGPAAFPAPDGLPRFEVGPLNADAEQALLRAVLGKDGSSDVLAAAHRASGGYAGRLCTLLHRGFFDGRNLTQASEWAGLAAPSAWLGSLGGDALQLARLLSVAEGELRPEGAAALLGGAEPATRARDELRARGLLREGGEGAARLEEEFAVQVRAQLGPEALPVARQLAQVLGPAHAATWVTVLADEPERAQAALLEAARRARAHGQPRACVAVLSEGLRTLDTEPLRRELADAQRALGLYRDALICLGPCRGDEALLLRAEVARLNGDLAAAEASLTDLLGAPDLSVRERAQALLGRVLLDRGDSARATAMVARLPLESRARLRAREVRVLCALSIGAPGEQEAARLLEEARTGADPRALSRALMLTAQLSVGRGQFESAAHELREAQACSRAAGEAHEAASIATNLGLVELDAGELGAALSTLRAGVASLVSLGREAELARALYNLANAAWLVGDLIVAETTLCEARERGALQHDATLTACLSIAEAELALHRGALDEAHRVLGAALAQHGQAEHPLRCLVACRAACAALAASDVSAVQAALALAAGWLWPGDAVQTAEYAVARARSLLSQGDGEGAERCVAEALDTCGERLPYEAKLRLLWTGVDVARASGSAARADGRALQCRALLERALSSLEPDQRALFRAMPAHSRTLAQAGAVPVADPAPSNAASRVLLGAARRLFEATSEARLARAAVHVALQLVQAERALLIVQRVDGSVQVLAAATLGADPGPVYSRSIVERVWDDVSALVAIDAQHDARLNRAQSVFALGVRSVIAVPVRAFGGRAVLYLDDRLRAGAFGTPEREVLADLAELLAAAARVVSSLRMRRRVVRKARKQVRRLESQLSEHEPAILGAPLVGESRALQGALRLARRVAASSAPVLVQGESGTGKELLARFIHGHSERGTRPFVAENCAALPEGLLESALFGHERGAFTGADRARVGLFETAHTGTLFLDEVAEMSPALQAKLLRVLQDGEVRPVGSDRTRHVDVRVLSATQRDLMVLVRDRLFREDLFYRLAVVTVALPPLRDRLEDVPLLVAHFLSRHALGRQVRVSEQALLALQERAWPGNVRQLESEILRGLSLCDDVIDLAHLSVATGDAMPLGLDLRSHTEALQKQLVRRALDATGGNQTRAAALLGVSRYGLQKMLRRLDLD